MIRSRLVPKPIDNPSGTRTPAGRELASGMPTSVGHLGRRGIGPPPEQMSKRKPRRCGPLINRCESVSPAGAKFSGTDDVLAHEDSIMAADLAPLYPPVKPVNEDSWA